MLASCAADPATLRIATTTSVDNSGLLDAVLPAFEQATGADVRAIAVGSGQAFQLARRGDVALLMSHEPLGERRLFDDGLVRYYRKFMFNRFVIAGPGADPAGIRGTASAVDAMARIARSGAVFVSRGDESGTHAREKLLWQMAGAAPARAQLIETGQGMSSTLRVASERGGYVLTDEATLARLTGAVALETLVAGDPVLINTYAIAILSTSRPSELALAERLARWIAEGDGQTHIDAFRINGRAVFFRWPDGADPTMPEAVPGAR